MYIYIYFYIPVCPVKHYYCPTASLPTIVMSYIFIYLQCNKKI